MLQEIDLLVTGTISSTNSQDLHPGSALAFSDSKDFQRHLGEKAKTLTSKTDAILKRLASARGQVKPEVAELESQVKTLLAQQKDLIVKVDRLETQNASLSEQYDKATLKAIKAERKLDRLRSAQVQKLEQQAIASSTRSVPKDENRSGSGGSDGNNEELKRKCHEAEAVVTKLKQRLETVLSENKALMDENSSLKIKKEVMTDEEYVRTDAFKQFKAQNEDLIKRVNHLEATNRQFREEAEKLRAERTEWKMKVEAEAQAVTAELEKELHQKDQDLARIRSVRDELNAEVMMRKAAQEQERASITQLKELVDAQSARIEELESELGRLRSNEASSVTPDIEAIPVDELRQKYAKLEKDFEAINKELPLLEKSYKATMSLAHKKVMDHINIEETVAKLQAEKNKADQKYFAARRDMDARSHEIRMLRAQNGKSSEIISQLKEVETQNRNLISSLEKQIVSLKQDISNTVAERKRLEQLSNDATRKADSCKSQIQSLTELVKAKDAAVASMKEQLLKAETELERLKVDVKELTKDCHKWKQKAQNNMSEEEEALRVSLDTFSPVFCECDANCNPELGDLLRLPKQFQKHLPERLRPRLLQPMRGRPDYQPYEKMPELQQSLRPFRCHACPPLANARADNAIMSWSLFFPNVVAQREEAWLFRLGRICVVRPNCADYVS
mgnify:CR=1 FL=1